MRLPRSAWGQERAPCPRRARALCGSGACVATAVNECVNEYVQTGFATLRNTGFRILRRLRLRLRLRLPLPLPLRLRLRLSLVEQTEPFPCPGVDGEPGGRNQIGLGRRGRYGRRATRGTAAAPQPVRALGGMEYVRQAVRLTGGAVLGQSDRVVTDEVCGHDVRLRHGPRARPAVAPVEHEGRTAGAVRTVQDQFAALVEERREQLRVPPVQGGGVRVDGPAQVRPVPYVLPAVDRVG